MARSFYHIPSDTTPLVSDGVLLEQATFQKGTNLLAAAISGANIVGGAGCIDGLMALSLKEFVIDNEIIGLTRKLFSGFEISDETLALECIHRVGPKGTFLNDIHTLENFRSQSMYTPTLFSYENHSSWQKEARQLADKASEQVNIVLKEHAVPPLEDHVIKELNRIIKAADKEIG